jgi:hypothetical protein
MPDKTPITLIYVAVAAAASLFAIAIWLIFFAAPQASPEPQAGPELTDEAALAVLKPELFAECRSEGLEGSYKSCITESSKAGEGWIFRVTYDGLYDDSVKASRVEAYFLYQNDHWTARDVVHMSQCYAGRGHENFSTELCV